MGCAASTPTSIENAETYTFIEHSKLPFAELRRGLAKEPTPSADDVVCRKALFQSSTTVIQKICGSSTCETIKLVTPELSAQHHVLELKKFNGIDAKFGKALLLTSATETWLMVFKGSRIIQSGTMFIHKLASKAEVPGNPAVNHAKVMKLTAEKWELFDGPDPKAADATLVATAKDTASLAFCGFTANVCPGRSDLGLCLALLVGAHLLVATQNYYRPSEKRALGDKGSLGALMLTGAAAGVNPITTFTDPLGSKMVDGLRNGADARLQHGHDAKVFHGITAWADEQEHVQSEGATVVSDAAAAA